MLSGPGTAEQLERFKGKEEDDEEEPSAAPANSGGEIGQEGAKGAATVRERESKLCFEERQMLWKGMTGSCWADLVQQWGVTHSRVGEVGAVQLQKSIAAVMGGSSLEPGSNWDGRHWRGATGMGQSEEAMGMLEAARHAKRLRGAGLEGEEGQSRWPAHRLLEWAAKELALSRRGVELEMNSLDDRLQRGQIERRMGDSLLKWLGFDQPPQAAMGKTQDVEG